MNGKESKTFAEQKNPSSFVVFFSLSSSSDAHSLMTTGRQFLNEIKRIMDIRSESQDIQDLILEFKENEQNTQNIEVEKREERENITVQNVDGKQSEENPSAAAIIYPFLTEQFMAKKKRRVAKAFRKRIREIKSGKRLRAGDILYAGRDKSLQTDDCYSSQTEEETQCSGPSQQV